MITPEVIHNTSEALLTLAPFILTLMPTVWKNLNLRDRGDVWDGSNKNLEIAHINHDQKYPKRDDESNLRMLSPRNHYRDHVNRVGRNGLTL